MPTASDHYGVSYTGPCWVSCTLGGVWSGRHHALLASVPLSATRQQPLYQFHGTALSIVFQVYLS